MIGAGATAMGSSSRGDRGSTALWESVAREQDGRQGTEGSRGEASRVWGVPAEMTGQDPR